MRKPVEEKIILVKLARNSMGGKIPSAVEARHLCGQKAIIVSSSVRSDIWKPSEMTMLLLTELKFERCGFYNYFAPTALAESRVVFAFTAFKRKGCLRNNATIGSTGGFF